MLDATVSRALNTEPEKRFRSAAEMREALEAALREPETSPADRRRWVARGLASAIALSVIGLAGAVATQPAMREKAKTALAPVMVKAHALQARAAERMHAAHPESAVAQSEPQKTEVPAVVEVNAAPVEAAAPITAEPVAQNAPAAQVAAAPAAADNDDGEVEDDSPSKDVTPAEKPDEASAKADAPASSSGDEAIAEAHRLGAQGNKLKALHVLRRAAKKYPKDAKVLQELATAAEADHAWGEATRAARHWVAAAPSAESKLELARLERKTGHRERALELVKSVLKDSPDSPEAHAMMTQLGGTERVALQK